MNNEPSQNRKGLEVEFFKALQVHFSALVVSAQVCTRSQVLLLSLSECAEAIQLFILLDTCAMTCEGI